METRKVVVTGMGALTPIGNNVDTFWKNLIAGKSGAGPVTKFDASALKTRFACEIKDFDPLDHFERKEIKRMDLHSQYALVTVEEAIKDSGLTVKELKSDRTGVIWSTCMGGIETLEKEIIEYARNGNRPRFSPFFITKITPNITSGLISIKFGITGMSFTVASACASSANAFIDALNYIRLGKADIIITGGSDASINIATMGGFSAINALSKKNETPLTASSPFDKSRDGFVMAEGSGALVLEEYEHARQRGAKIYAELAGGGCTSDAFHITASHPEGRGAYLAMKKALEDAGISPAQIDYINAHATSTPVGDTRELKAIEKLFGNYLSNLNVSSTKSMTGHLLGAAGAVEAIAAIKAIQNSVIPPTINTQMVDPAINPEFNLTLQKAQKKEVNFAMSNTFGFGGHNTIVVFKKISK